MFSRKLANLVPPQKSHLSRTKLGADPYLGVTYQFNKVPALTNKHTQVEQRGRSNIWYKCKPNRRHEDLFQKI
jgi:hypothetical protein